MRWLVDACYLAALVAMAPLMAYRAWTTGKYRAGWAERLGRVPYLPAGRRRVWVHAVSVGEMNAVRGLIQAWRAADPGLDVVVSTTTDTGQARARQLFPELLVIRWPLDLSWCVMRALGRIAPSMVVLVELEVWYQFATLAAARGIGVAVINGRLSKRSVDRFHLVGWLVRRMFRSLAWVGAQDEVYGERFRYVGVPSERVSVTGSLKWDTAEITDRVPGTDQLAAAMGLDGPDPVWVCGSTGPGEEAVILEAFGRLRPEHPDLRLAIVPRKPERFDEVAGLIRGAGFECLRRSRNPEGGRPAAQTSCVRLGDSMGELRKFYCLADVVLVGRSLAAMGGSDAMEVAALCKPMISGPHNENFADVATQLKQAGAMTVLNADLAEPSAAASQVAEAVHRLLQDTSAARRMGLAGLETVRRNRGATGRTLTCLTETLDRAQHPAS